MKNRKQTNSKLIPVLLYTMIALFIVFFSACSTPNQHEIGSAPVADEVDHQADMDAIDTEEVTGSVEKEVAQAPEELWSVGLNTENDGDRKLIRTADMKFSVHDVYQSTIDIESIILTNKGFITESRLNSNVLQSLEQEKGDSIIEWNIAKKTNRITFRVPKDSLEQCLVDIAKEVDELNYRVLLGTDVSFSILEKELAQKRAQNASNQINRDKSNQSGDLQDHVFATNTRQQIAEQRDRAKIEQLELEDKIAFSTVTLYLEGPKQTTKQVYANPELMIQQQGIGFGRKLINAFASGFELIQTLILWLVQIWPVVLLLSALAYWWTHRRTKPSK